MQLIEIEHQGSSIIVKDFILKYSEIILQKNNIQESEEDRQHRRDKIENDVLAACKPYYNGELDQPLFPRDPDTLSHIETRFPKPRAFLLICVLDTNNLVHWFKRYKNTNLSFVDKSQPSKIEIKQTPPHVEPIASTLKQKKKLNKGETLQAIKVFINTASEAGVPPPEELLLLIEAEFSHANSVLHSEKQQEILGAAVSILYNYQGNMTLKTVAQLVKVIDEKSPIFWRENGEPPLEQRKMVSILNQWIKQLQPSKK